MIKVFLCVGTEHNLWIVFIAALICVAATFATFFLYSRAPAFPEWRRWAWLGMVGLVAGSGIWTTHFLGMLAFKTGLPTGYAALPTLGSLLVAVVGATLGFALGAAATHRRDQGLTSIAGGLVVGLGITLMHYIGMSGYRTAGTLQWDTRYIAASVVIGALFAAAALFVARPGARPSRQAVGAGLLTLGIVGMHFTGMTAVTVIPNSAVEVAPSLMSEGAMAIAAIAVTALIMITAIGGVASDTASRSAGLRRLREALDVMPEGLAFYDAFDRLVAWNSRYADLCEASGAKLVAGLPFRELVEAEVTHGAYPAAVGREAEWLARREAAYRGDGPGLTEQTAGGRWLRITDRRTADGGAVCVSVDITDLKRAEAAMAQARDEAEELARRAEAAELAITASEERFRRLAVNAPDMITEAGLDGVLTYVSPASLAITGFTPEELVGQTFVSVMEPEDGQKVLDMCQAVFASKGAVAPWVVEFRVRSKSGEPLWLECKPTLAVDPLTGRFTGLTDVVRDITERKALEARLRLAQADAESAAAVKGEFLANMSHELRTPLTSIIGFTGLAAEQADLTDLTRTYVERVGDASRALLCTVNDILDFSKLEAGQVTIQPQPVALSRLGRSTLDLFTPQAGAKDLTLTLDQEGGDGDMVVAVDPDRIRQILLNLVSNAVKFTSAGGVTLRMRYGEGVLDVEVIDTGGGIPQDKQDRLFKRFSQIDGSLTRVQGGTGLGLAICKGLVEAMGGEIGVESRMGQGSRFWFRIPAPLSDLALASVDGGAIERPMFTGARVLVVDDHPANRELARLYLMGVGAEVTEACDGEEAVQLAASWPFDVILMDIRMPILDGPGALRRIRAIAGPNDATPILGFTADADVAAVERLAALGFQDVVAKPVEAADLIGAVARATAYASDPQLLELINVG